MSAAEQAREKLVDYSEQSRYVNGRNFFQNGSQWLDSEVQNNQAAKRVRMQFNSPDYFAFLAKNRQALPWLALGQNVEFVPDGVVYDVYGMIRRTARFNAKRGRRKGAESPFLLLRLCAFGDFALKRLFNAGAAPAACVFAFKGVTGSDERKRDQQDHRGQRPFEVAS